MQYKLTHQKKFFQKFSIISLRRFLKNFSFMFRSLIALIIFLLTVILIKKSFFLLFSPYSLHMHNEEGVSDITGGNICLFR